MSEFSFALVRLYLGCAAALTVGACFIQLGAYVWEKKKNLLPARSVLKASYALLLLSVATPLLVHQFGVRSVDWIRSHLDFEIKSAIQFS